ncbi:MAG TPA: hypothetical protein PKH71_02275, partial [Methanoregulaceae archaeon]|nr:hypothetical protein [Methanoregulaceae archaeon]
MPADPGPRCTRKGVTAMREHGVFSEVGRLRTVMVHRPDLSLRRLTPANHEEFLFDDVIWVDRAIQEVSGVDFASWDKKWRAYLASTPHDLPPELAPGANVPHVQEV